MAESRAAVQWTVADLELLPDDGQRYEVIEGELFVSRAPGNDHQETLSECIGALVAWNSTARLGHVLTTPGLIFTTLSGVIADGVWVSRQRRALLEREDRKLHGAPELVVEVLSPGEDNERRDREVKLKLYSSHGVEEYWILDRQRETAAVYRHQEVQLRLDATLTRDDTLTPPLLPGFAVPVAQFFPR